MPLEQVDKRLDPCGQANATAEGEVWELYTISRERNLVPGPILLCSSQKQGEIHRKMLSSSAPFLAQMCRVQHGESFISLGSI